MKRIKYSKCCQKEYNSVPTTYYCYCGKEKNPPFDPWLPPHSCGAICGRTLRCGHVCNERCHSGKCPPCPRLVSIKCPCGKKEFMIRCSMQHLQLPENTCGQCCGKVLSCGKHHCSEICHYGDCPPCQELVHQVCYCGSEERDMPCSSVTSQFYSCGKICNKILKCGHHHCSLPCHEGPCEECPNKPPRTCFCGKKGYFSHFDFIF